MYQFLLFPEPKERKNYGKNLNLKVKNQFNKTKCICKNTNKNSAKRFSRWKGCVCLKALFNFKHLDKKRSILAKRKIGADFSHSPLVEYNEDLYYGHLKSWAMRFPTLI